MVDDSPIDQFARIRKRFGSVYVGATFGYAAFRTDKGLRNLGCRIVLVGREPHQQWRFDGERDGVVASRGWISLEDADAVVSAFATGVVSLGGQRLLLCDPDRLGNFQISGSENSELTRRLIGWPAWELAGIWGEPAPQVVGAAEFERLRKRLPGDATHYFADWQRLSEFLCEGDGEPFEISHRSYVVAGVYAPLRARLEGPVRRRKARVAVAVISEVDPRLIGLAVVLAPRGGLAQTVAPERWRPVTDSKWEVEGQFPNEAHRVDAGLLVDGVPVDEVKPHVSPMGVHEKERHRGGLGRVPAGNVRQSLFTASWWQEHLAEAVILFVVTVAAGLVVWFFQIAPNRSHHGQAPPSEEIQPSTSPQLPDTGSRAHSERSAGARHARPIRNEPIVTRYSGSTVEGDSLGKKQPSPSVATSGPIENNLHALRGTGDTLVPVRRSPDSGAPAQDLIYDSDFSNIEEGQLPSGWSGNGWVVKAGPDGQRHLMTFRVGENLLLRSEPILFPENFELVIRATWQHCLFILLNDLEILIRTDGYAAVSGDKMDVGGRFAASDIHTVTIRRRGMGIVILFDGVEAYVGRHDVGRLVNIKFMNKRRFSDSCAIWGITLYQITARRLN